MKTSEFYETMCKYVSSTEHASCTLIHKYCLFVLNYLGENREFYYLNQMCSHGKTSRWAEREALYETE